MFHRRLLLVFTALVAATVALGAQMVRLSVVQGEQRSLVVEGRLDLVRYTPSVRGRILDRQGRVLAVDRPSYDVSVFYDVITGGWALQQAVVEAASTAGERWPKLGPDERVAAVDRFLPQFQATVTGIWDEIMVLGGIDRPELDRRLDAIKRDVESVAADVWYKQRQLFIDEYKYEELDEAAINFAQRPILEETEAHVVVPRVDDETAFRARRLADRFPKLVAVTASHTRHYPWLEVEVVVDRSTMPGPLRSDSPLTVVVTGLADHILGAMRPDIYESDVERRPFRSKDGQIDLKGYLTGDAVGNRGLERVFEDHLRGRRGMMHTRLDSGRVEQEPFEAGEDLHLTIDIALQARVQAILSNQTSLTVVQPWQENPGLSDGTPLNSAAVVLEVETGEILAMVSMPTLAMGREMSAAQRFRNTPLSNRPIESIYPPGSIIKPLTLVAAVSEDAHDLMGAVTCNGQFYAEHRDFARCWLYRPPAYATHGPLVADEAVARSCNIYFYTLAQELGAERLLDWFHRFGLGVTFDTGLYYQVTPNLFFGENRGRIPDDAALSEMRELGQLESATIFMGIGQGPLAWSPLHAANALATIARYGRMRDPTVLADDPRSSTYRRPQRDLDLDSHAVAAVLEGLRQSVAQPYGTTHHIRELAEPIIDAAGVTVWAKTGTAQAPPWRIADTNGDGKADKEDEAIEDLDHAWFVGLVGPGSGASATPRYAIAVLVEYGGSGGRTSGPIGNQIIAALQAEGYLPGADG